MTKSHVAPPESDWSWGIDTVELSLIVNPDHCDLAPSCPFWTRSSSQNLMKGLPELATFTGFLRKDWGDVRVTVYSARNICTLYFNAARMVTPRSEALLPVAALPKLVEAVLTELSDVIWPQFLTVDYSTGEIVWDRRWMSQVTFKRLDLARNFLVSDPDVVKSGLAAIQSRYQRTKTIHTSANLGWTLENRTSKSGMERFYDKDADLDRHRGDEPDGGEERIREAGERLFRFEAQIQKRRLDRLGIKTLDRLTEARAWTSLEERWDATRWGSPLPSRGDVLAATSSLKPLHQMNLIGYLHLAEAGATSRLTAWQVRNANARAKACGLVPGVPVRMLGEPCERLDLHAGRLVSLSEEDASGRSEVG